jgi:hypothetical protein
MLDWFGSPAAGRRRAGRQAVVLVEDEVDPERPKMASSVPARSRALVFSAKQKKNALPAVDVRVELRRGGRWFPSLLARVDDERFVAVPAR